MLRIPIRNFGSCAGLSGVSTPEIRSTFIKYFEGYDHIHVPSSSVVPEDDDRSLLFTNAGMNQFKSIFLGSTDNRWAYIQRAVNYQKCIRAGGKHNDLNDVGSDFHHQTFFEMLGNWSFNDSYGKKEACDLAWNFLVHVLKIDPSRLYVTYFAGNKDMAADEACKKIWLNLGLNESHILPFQAENFWEMGPIGPCGPCTEIHYDRVPGRTGTGHLVNKDDSVIELWNIVFMNSYRNLNGTLSPLPNRHIDTGMGLERLASVVQGVPSNFDTDMFRPIINGLVEQGTMPYQGVVGLRDPAKVDASYRIVADHLRAVTVAIGDGAFPAGTGVGHVVRKMLRKAAWRSNCFLSIERGICAEMVPLIVDTLKMAYPDLTTRVNSIQKIVSDEEERYWKTIEKGQKMIDIMLHRLPNVGDIFSGDEAFILHDTHGIPVEITQDIVSQRGKTVDMDRFEQLRHDARATTKKSCTFAALPVSLDAFPTHNDDAKYNYVLHDGLHVFPKVQSRILALFSENSIMLSNSIKGRGFVLLEDCQFYAEEGGQKSDYGILKVDGKSIFCVDSAQKMSGVTILQGSTIDEEELNLVDRVTQEIDVERRCGLMRAHTATHLLNWALMRVGGGVGQRGSSVEPDYLRFHYAIGENSGEDDVMRDVEQLIKIYIERGERVLVEHIPLKDARKIDKLQSQFRPDKEYPEFVRVTRVGQSYEQAVAVECCGGTHVLNTRAIGDFVICSDRSAARGVRRVAAYTGEKAKSARAYAKQLIADLNNIISGTKEVNWIEFQKFIDLNRIPHSSTNEVNQLMKKAKIASRRMRSV